MLVYLVTVDDLNILVDTGVGDLPEQGDAPGVLLDCLLDEGVGTEDVDIVIYTHLHPDHIGGGVQHDRELTFPHARYVASAAEWGFWNDPAWREPEWDWLGQSFRRRLDPLDPSGRLELVVAGDQVESCMRTRDLSGHTPGQLGLEIDTGSSTVLFIGDALHHPAQWNNPHWNFRYDADPSQASSRRTELVAELVDTDTIVASAHFPLTGMGRVVRSDRGVTWRAIGATTWT